MNSTPERPPLVRSSDRMIAGVCSGLAQHLRWPVRYVRLGMLLAAVLGGPGLVLYAFLWMTVPSHEDVARRVPRPPGFAVAPEVTPRPARESSGTAVSSEAAQAWQRFTQIRYGKEILLGVGLLLVASYVIARLLGAELPLETLFPVAAILCGAAIAWMQLDDRRRSAVMETTRLRQAGGWGRLAAGLALVIVGVLVMVSGSASWQQMWLALLASIAVLLGVGVVLLPWGLKLWRDLGAERAARVRESERAEIAAHLHDSVLQTLALIQRKAAQESEVVKLARSQERELRRWLFDDSGPGSGTLGERLRATAADVEDQHGQLVEVVIVGDSGITEAQEALVQAAREAMFNAARHARGTVSVYAEASKEAIEIFIKDRGPGFNMDDVPEDRLGVRESIVGRMKRHGGSAVINSGPDGTEVRLRLPQQHAAENREDES